MSVTGDCKVSCLESLSVGSKPMVALSLAELPGDTGPTGDLVLAMGGLDQKVHLYCGDRTGKVCKVVNLFCKLIFAFCVSLSF